MAPSRGFTKEEIDKIIELSGKGETLSDIGKLFGVSGTTIKYQLKKAGRFDPDRNKMSEEDKAEMMRMYEGHVPLDEIAERFGITPWTVSRKMKNWGVPLNGSKRRYFIHRFGIQEEDVVKKYAELGDINETAKFYGVTDVTLRTLFRKHGVASIADEPVKKVYREKDRIHELYYKRTFSLQEIADEYGISISCLSNKFREWKWKTRDMTVGNTSIERAVAAMLDELAVGYRKQFPLEIKFFDIGLPDYGLLIETNGDYWHGNPLFYKDSDLDKTQRSSRARDLTKAKLAAKHGFRLLFLWENDIKKDPDGVQARILETLRATWE